MNSDQLRYLIDIAKTGSINTTAKRLFTSQPAVSESIKRLEKELNGTILERSKKGVELTKDGKFVLSHAIPMMEHYQELLRYFENKNTVPQGVISIGSAALLTNTLLSELIFKMQEHYPNVALYTSELFFDDILDSCAKGEIDFGLSGVSPMRQNLIDAYSTTLCFQPLYSDSIVCVMHKNNPLSSSTEITSEIAQHAVYTIYGYSEYPLSSSFSCLHISSNVDIHKKFMQERNTFCLLPQHSAERLFAEKDFVALPLADAMVTTYYLIYRKSEDIAGNDVYKTFVQTVIDLTKNIK